VLELGHFVLEEVVVGAKDGVEVDCGGGLLEGGEAGVVAVDVVDGVIVEGLGDEEGALVDGDLEARWGRCVLRLVRNCSSLATGAVARTSSM
jgi:hypothetical protein